jgi:hypothetical protein
LSRPAGSSPRFRLIFAFVRFESEHFRAAGSTSLYVL